MGFDPRPVVWRIQKRSEQFALRRAEIVHFIHLRAFNRYLYRRWDGMPVALP